MEVKQLPIDSIKPYKRNPRNNDEAVGAVIQSIKKFGFRQPIVVDPENVIIVGHTRYRAAMELKLKTIPVHQATDMTPEQIKAYRIADNKTSELASWNKELLAVEIGELQQLNFDLGPLGFSKDELKRILLTGKEGMTNDDSIPDVPAEPVTKVGDLYTMGNHRLLCGDATKREDVARLVNGQRMNLMVTDPPYGVNYEPEWRDGHDLNMGKQLGLPGQGRAIGKVYNDNKIDWSDAYALFNGDVCYVWHAGKYAKQVQESIEKCGFEIVNQIVWVKHHFVFSRRDYHWKHEPCWYAVRKGQKHNWQGDRKQTTVWDIENNNPVGHKKDKEEKTGHSTQKPVECMLRPIENNSQPHDLVYDPFLGSGSTLIACEKTDRICYGIEIDPHYCDVIVKRWKNFTGDDVKRV